MPPVVVLSGAEPRLWSRTPALRRHAARLEQHCGHVESVSLLAVNEHAQQTRSACPTRRPLHGIDADEAELKRHLVYKSIARRVLAPGARRDVCHELAVPLRSELLEPNDSTVASERVVMAGTHLVSKSCSVGVV